MGLVLKIFIEILKKLDGNTVKLVIDKGLDIIENKLAQDGVTNAEQVVLEGIKFLRNQLGITEEEGSPFADK